MQTNFIYATKQMKAERDMPRTHFEAHFSEGCRPRGLSQSTEIVIRLKAPCLHLAKRYFDCQKTKGAGFKASQGSCPLLQFS